MGAFKSLASPLAGTVVLDGEVEVVVFNRVTGVVVLAGGVAVVESFALGSGIQTGAPTAEVGAAVAVTWVSEVVALVVESTGSLRLLRGEDWQDPRARGRGGG
jgi:hypothetical protein